MIRLVKNEYTKIGHFKLNLPFIIFTIVILIMKEVEGLSFVKIYSLISFIGLCNCALFGGIISNEIENGTFRIYLTKPVKREKIYLSKYIMMCFYTFVLSLFIYFMFVLIIRNFESKILFKYLMYTIPLYLLNSIIIFVSTIIRNTAIVVSICIFLLVFSLVIVQILFGLNRSINLIGFGTNIKIASNTDKYLAILCRSSGIRQCEKLRPKFVNMPKYSLFDSLKGIPVL